MSDSLWLYGMYLARLLCPWDFPGKILEWVDISFSRGSSWPRDRTHVSCIGRQILYHWVTWEALFEIYVNENHSVVYDSLWPHGLYSPWNSPGQNIGMGSCSLLQGIFPNQGSTQVSCIAGGFFTNWANRETPKGCVASTSGNRTLISHVTGSNTHHYTKNNL